MFKAVLLAAVMQAALVSVASASGGSIYESGRGFTIIGIDDGTWTDINICDSKENATAGAPPHCLILKKGAKAEGGWTTYSDARSGCRLLGKYMQQDFATGNSDDESSLSQFIAVIKAPKGSRGCTLPVDLMGTMVRRSVTGLYR